MLNKKLTVTSILFALILLVSWWIYKELTPLYSEMQALKNPRFEPGENKGARFCATCHQQIYDQWAKSSRHAIATTAQSFHHYKDLFTGNFIHNTLMGEELCYACHGSKAVNEGVNCETCHGIADPNVPIMETHEQKFKANRDKLNKAEFCGKCHEIKNPLSGDLIIASYSEWQGSEAAKQGITCQECHMKSRRGKLAYHGFDTLIRNPNIYNGDISINDIKLQFPLLSLVIENHIKGHGIPAGGPSNVLVLEVFFKDKNGNILFKATETFSKYFSLMPVAGIMPYKLLKNTQLKSGEKRQVRIKLPIGVSKDKITKVELSLKLFQVSDEYQGNIAKAHWKSKPIAKQELSLLE